MPKDMILQNGSTQVSELVVDRGAQLLYDIEGLTGERKELLFADQGTGE
jgi:hypothetical protein